MELTLHKDERILKSVEFRRTLRYGKRFRRSHLTVVALRRSSGKVRLGLTVSKKVGKAVIRNLVKRRLREIVRHSRGGLSNSWDLVVIARPGAGSETFSILRRQIESVFFELTQQELLGSRGVRFGKRNTPHGSKQTRRRQGRSR